MSLPLRCCAAALVVVLVLSVQTLCADDADVRAELEQFLIDGETQGAADMLTARLKQHPEDAQAQFGLGIVRVLQGVEHLAQNLHRYGLRSSSPRLPFVRLPVPENPDPERITYELWRGILQQFVDDMETASAELGKVQADDVKLKLPVGMIRLDLNADGRSSDEETFWKVFTAVAWRAAKLDDDQKRFEIGFDRADVHWLNGYTHLLRAMAEAWLAHDSQEFYRFTAPAIFAGADPPGAELGQKNNRGFNVDSFADAIAAIHLMRLEPTEPERMQAAHQHLLSMIGQSRQCWEHAIKESDDDREWIPNAKQTSLTPLTVNQERIDGWRAFLDEAEMVLNGEHLLPHWRVNDERGINLKRVFTEPQTFDLVMWVHGAAAIPYLEEGELVSDETAGTLSRIFQGRFVAFAVWFQ